MNIEKLKIKTQNIVNLFIRLKYALITSEGLVAKCFCCGKIWLLDSKEAKQNYHAMHYWRADKFGFQSVRYSHDNIRGGCKKCNRNLHGNLAVFQEKLVEEIGQERFDILTFLKNRPKKWTSLELEMIIAHHQNLLNEPEILKKLKIYKAKQ